MAYLMCMDTPVYDTIKKKVLAPHLMPCPVEYYEEWRNSRLFLRGTNRMPEEDERELGVNSLTVKRRLSLSDSYWVKYSKDKAQGGFYQLTPYLNDFYEYGVRDSSKSSPSLTVTGSVNKIWRNVNGSIVLYKVMQPMWVDAEVAAVSLAKKLNLPINEVTRVSNTELYIHNFTNPDVMLMRLNYWDLPASSKAKVPSDFGYSFSKVDSVYKRLNIQGYSHIITILFDVIVSNYDRITNLSNWGYFKSGIDGKNAHCPMYDFNLAHPHQRNMYLYTVKPQLTYEHKRLLMKWRSVVASHGYPMWIENLDKLLE